MVILNRCIINSEVGDMLIKLKDYNIIKHDAVYNNFYLNRYWDYIINKKAKSYTQDIEKFADVVDGWASDYGLYLLVVVHYIISNNMDYLQGPLDSTVQKTYNFYKQHIAYYNPLYNEWQIGKAIQWLIYHGLLRDQNEKV